MAKRKTCQPKGFPTGELAPKATEEVKLSSAARLFGFIIFFLFHVLHPPLHSKRIIKEIEAFPSAVRLVVKVLSPFTAERLGEGFITFTAFRLVVKVLVFLPQFKVLFHLIHSGCLLYDGYTGV